MKNYILKLGEIIICMSIILGVCGVVPLDNHEPITGDVALTEY